MDYNQAALKLMCKQLKQAKKPPSQSSFSYGGILFQRAWIQGILISVYDVDDDGSRFLLDDGTGVVQLQVPPNFLNQNHWIVGMYVMVVGHYVVNDGQIPMIKVHKIVDLSAFPDREAMWYLEVIEAFKMFYQHLLEE